MKDINHCFHLVSWRPKPLAAAVARIACQHTINRALYNRLKKSFYVQTCNAYSTEKVGFCKIVKRAWIQQASMNPSSVCIYHQHHTYTCCIHIGTWTSPKGREAMWTESRVMFCRCTTCRVRTHDALSKESVSRHPHQDSPLICANPYKTNSPRKCHMTETVHMHSVAGTLSIHREYMQRGLRWGGTERWTTVDVHKQKDLVFPWVLVCVWFYKAYVIHYASARQAQMRVRMKNPPRHINKPSSCTGDPCRVCFTWICRLHQNIPMGTCPWIILYVRPTWNMVYHG